MKLEGIGSPEEAALLRGARLLIRRSDRAPPQDQDEFYVQVHAAAAPFPTLTTFPTRRARVWSSCGTAGAVPPQHAHRWCSAARPHHCSPQTRAASE